MPLNPYRIYRNTLRIFLCIFMTAGLMIASSFAQEKSTEKPTAAELMENARRLNLKVLQDYDAGYISSAISKAFQVLKIYREILNESHPDIATVHENIAELLSRQRRYKEALNHQQLALQIRRKAFGDSHLLVAETMRKLAFIYTRRGQYEAADSLYQQALEIVKSKLGPKHSDLKPFADDLRNLAVFFESRNQLSRAESLYTQAFHIIEMTLGARSKNLTSLTRDLRSLALLYDKRGNLTSADTLYQRALDNFKFILSVDDPEVIRAAENIRDVAGAFLAKDDLEQSLRLYEISHRIIENALGGDHDYLTGFSQNFRNLGHAYRDQNELQKAWRRYDTAHIILTKSVGKNHPDQADIAGDYRELGKLYQANGHLWQAKQLFDTNFSIMSDVLGKNHPKLAAYAQNYRELGKLHQQQNDLANARFLFDRALTIIENSLGDTHPDRTIIAKDYRELAKLYLAGDIYDAQEGERLLMRSINIFETSLGEYDPEILASAEELVKLAQRYEAEDGGGNALDIYQYVLPIMQSIQGEDAPAVVAIRQKIQELIANSNLGHIRIALGAAAAEPQETRSEYLPSAAGEMPPNPREVIDVIRYPTMKAPNIVKPDQMFDVNVSLTEELLTPEVETLEGRTTEKGQLIMRLPDQEKWDIDIILSVPGFQIKNDANIITVTLPREGNSTEAVFHIAVPSAGCGPARTTIYATLWHKGAFLAKIARKIRVSETKPVSNQVSAINAERAEAAVTNGTSENAKTATPVNSGAGIDVEMATYNASAPANSVATATTAIKNENITQVSSISLSPSYQTPDLTLWILKDFDDENAGRYELQINSPYLQPYSGSFVVAPETADWLKSQSSCIMRGAVPINTANNNPCLSNQNPIQNINRLKGFGKLLYRKMAPDEVRSSIEQLLEKLGDRFQSIQIYTNNPGIPWELMHTDKPIKGFEKPDFLGSRFRIARWHISGNHNLITRPPQRSPMREVVLISPRYEGRLSLPSQLKEVTALQSINGYRRVAGKFGPLRDLFGNYPAGIIHFAGHGEVRNSMEGIPEYVILLEDTPLDLMSWRGMIAYEAGNHPFIFFNACEIGQSHNVANFVDGWAPAILESGASGYVGGLWPLSDASAAEFAVNFYQRLDTQLQNGAVNIADLLRKTRQRFSENGDPTFLAYVYYGDPNFEFVRK